MQQEISYDIPDLRTTFPRAHTYLLAVDEACRLQFLVVASIGSVSTGPSSHDFLCHMEADGQSENPFIEKLKEKIFECCKKEVTLMAFAASACSQLCCAASVVQCCFAL